MIIAVENTCIIYIYTCCASDRFSFDKKKTIEKYDRALYKKNGLEKKKSNRIPLGRRLRLSSCRYIIYTPGLKNTPREDIVNKKKKKGIKGHFNHEGRP